MASEEVLKEWVQSAAPLTHCITLSMTHMTQADSELLAKLSRPREDHHDVLEWVPENWVIDRYYGFILQLTQRENRLETLLNEGVSAALYTLLDSLTKDTGIAFVLFDRDETALKLFPTFDW